MSSKNAGNTAERTNVFATEKDRGALLSAPQKDETRGMRLVQFLVDADEKKLFEQYAASLGIRVGPLIRRLIRRELIGAGLREAPKKHATPDLLDI